MKKSLLSCASFLLLFSSAAAFAVKEGGGGDLQCDVKIKSISSNVESWIKDHGPDAGSLDLTSSANPKTSRPYLLSEYDSAMLDLLHLPLDSSCVTKGDDGYPVAVGDSSKVCTSFVDTDGLHMKCDQVKLLAMDPDQQIEQIHHEYAIHVPGLEPDYGPISTYKISSQLSDYTGDVVERRLIVSSGKHCGGSNCTASKKDVFNFTDAAQNFPNARKVPTDALIGSWYIQGMTVASGTTTPFIGIWQTGFNPEAQKTAESFSSTYLKFQSGEDPFGNKRFQVAMPRSFVPIQAGDWSVASQQDTGTCFIIPTVTSYSSSDSIYLNVECRGLAENSKLLCAISFNDDSTLLPASVNPFRRQIIGYMILIKGKI